MRDPASLRYFYTTFLNDCGRGESFRTTTCLRTVVRVSRDMLPVEHFSSNEPSFCVSCISLRSQGCHKDQVYLATLPFVDIADVIWWCLPDAFSFFFS